MNTSHSSICGVTRRGFLLGAATGLAAGVPAAWWGARLLHREEPVSRFTGSPGPEKTSGEPMPGRYPGRVIEVHHPHAVSADHAINGSVVEKMIDRGMAELTGADPRDIAGAWGKFFERGDVVGIKVNPVGRKRAEGSIGSISNPEVVLKIVRCLKEVGIRPQDIIIFERYANEFIEAGYAKMMNERDMDGVRWLASSSQYSDTQVDLAGFDEGRDNVSPELARHVTGYDPDVFTTMGFAGGWHNEKDDRRFRTHLSVIVSRLINKMITIPVLKDHRSGGVTLALKNLSHGMNNNVARSHLNLTEHGFSEDSTFVNGPNQCNTFIPTAVSQHVLRQRATLHILDGLIAVYEGGPGSWNKTWGTWRYNSLLFATDPVAMDHVGWDIIDAKRVRMGLLPVEQTGLVQRTPTATIRTGLTALASYGTLDAASLNMIARNVIDGWSSENFNLRQPEHVVLAGAVGLGKFKHEDIWHRRVDLTKEATSGAG
jgi:uncharacterized protein (DUF362 family)